MNRLWKRVATALRGISFSSIWLFRIINLQTFLTIGRFILYSVNIAITLFIIGFTLYELYLNPSVGNIINAAVETLTGSGIVIALIGSLIIGAAFAAIIAPILLLICFSLRAAKSIFYDLQKHCQTTKELIPNILNFIAGVLSVAVISLVLIAEMPIFGILGIISGLISVAAACLLMIEQFDKKKPMTTTLASLQSTQPCAVNSILPSRQNASHHRKTKHVGFGFFNVESTNPSYSPKNLDEYEEAVAPAQQAQAQKK